MLTTIQATVVSTVEESWEAFTGRDGAVRSAGRRLSVYVVTAEDQAPLTLMVGDEYVQSFRACQSAGFGVTMEFDVELRPFVDGRGKAQFSYRLKGVRSVATAARSGVWAVGAKGASGAGVQLVRSVRWGQR